MDSAKPPMACSIWVEIAVEMAVIICVMALVIALCTYVDKTVASC